MPIILIIIGIIAALGLGGFMWTNHKEEEVVTPPAITTTVTETPTPTEPDPTTQPESEPTPTTVTPTPVATTPTPTPTTPTPTPTPVTTPTPKTVYKNGTYSVGVTYKAPDRGDHPVTVKLTLANDVVTASEVTFGSEAREATAEFQNRFAAAYKSQVIGKSLDSIKLSRVGGASLTTNAWNAAQAQIAAQAKS